MNKNKLSRQLEFYKFINHVSDFFESEGLIKVYTPSLVKCPGLEPYLHGFKTQFRYGDKTKEFYLPTSPELHLKKLICLGSGSLFEVKTCFRNEELTDHHNPEFKMLEWYRVGADLNNIIEDIFNLLKHLKAKNLLSMSNITPLKKSMSLLFLEHLQFKLTPNTSLANLAKLLCDLKINVDKTDTWDDLFFKVFINKIEPKFKDYKQPLIVTDYPPSQAALAKINSSGWADRFELYIEGVELANAFNELTDPVEQLKRFKADQALKQKLGFDVPPIDEEFIVALEMGMPKCAGIALGLDRLFMVSKSINKLSDFNLFGNYVAD